MLISSLLEKILAVALGVAILGTGGALWFADHERQQLKPWQDKYANEHVAAIQAGIDRDAALKAASDAQAQIKAAQTAFKEQAEAAAAASGAAAAANAKLAALSKSPEAARVLTTNVPTDVWNAIYNQSEK